VNIDSVRDVIMSFPKTCITVNLCVNLAYADSNGRKLSSVSLFQKKTKTKYINADHENIMNIKTSDYIILEYNKRSANRDESVFSSASISYPHIYTFIKGIDDASKLIKDVIEYDSDDNPFISVENKSKNILIKDLANSKEIMFSPIVLHEDGLSPEIGFYMYINESTCYGFININTFMSFVYTMKKFDLYTASRTLLGTAAALSVLQSTKEENPIVPNSMSAKRKLPVQK
jgi:hypothetical protein